MNISNMNVRITFQQNAVVIDKIGNHGLSQFMVGKPLRGILKIAPKSGIMN